jgi:glutamyl-tRNA synthetase
MKLNTRIAPSPTGFMHIGTARTAYFNFLAAKASGGTFYLRIDDTDTDREVEGAVDVILNSLSWLGLDYDSEVIYQSQRKDVYRQWARWLISIGAAKELDNGAIALVWQDYMPRVWHDDIAGEMAISDKEAEQIDGLILMKGGDKLGQPIYHFASVVDDWNRINCIIRGTDHISNTGKQLAIWAAMNRFCEIQNERKTELDPVHGHFQTPPEFPRIAHVGLIHKNKKKMSKRDAVTDPTIFMAYYQENNYEPEAVLNFLLRMGWGPTVDDKSTTTLPRERAVELFLEGGKMRSAPANFDMAKLESFNRKYKGMRENALKATVNAVA